MALLGDALRQAFLMPRRAYAALRDDEHSLPPRLRRPLAVTAACCVAAAVAAAACVSLGIVFPAEPAERPFCRERRMLEALPAAASSREEEPEAYRYRGGAFYMTTAEAADFYWMVVFVPSAVLFGASFTYLVAGEPQSRSPRHCCDSFFCRTVCVILDRLLCLLSFLYWTLGLD
jgi:hypothetical protein